MVAVVSVSLGDRAEVRSVEICSVQPPNQALAWLIIILSFYWYARLDVVPLECGVVEFSGALISGRLSGNLCVEPESNHSNGLVLRA